MKKHISFIAVICAVILCAGCVSAPKELTRGVIENNVYKSEYASVTFTAPEGWVYTDDEELSQITGDVLSKHGEQASEDMLKNSMISDMLAKNPSTGSFVSLMYENLPVLAEQSGGGNWKSLTADDAIDSIITQLGEVQQYHIVAGGISDAKLGSQSFRMLYTEVTDDNSLSFYFVRKIDKYMLCIIISAASSDSMEDIIKCFS